MQYHECEVPGCRQKGQAHHIVFRSRGGLDIGMNYKYLCAEHHSVGRRSPHRNREVDLGYKIELQRKYFALFREPYYTIGEVAEKLGIKEKEARRHFKNVPGWGDAYAKEDIIRVLMGGRLY